MGLLFSGGHEKTECPVVHRPAELRRVVPIQGSAFSPAYSTLSDEVIRLEFFRVYFFDDLKQEPAELRRSILLFLGNDPNKPSGKLKPDDNRDAARGSFGSPPKCAPVLPNSLNRN
jgi:hypothetical protein